MKISLQVLFLGLLLLAVVCLSGCASVESENASSRPWGYRGGYDPGLPSIMNEGR